MWTYACESAPRTEQQCIEIMNNPVEIEDYEALLEENRTNCYFDGQDNGTEDKPFDKERASGCNDAGGGNYKGGYEFGCQRINTASECGLRIEGEKNYCPSHPDIVACVDFLHNATNKAQGEALKDTVCFQTFVTCLHESNPEKYCLNTNDTVFCNTVGDICDPDGFVRPEFPYCKQI
jgi:hypothetical protein